MAKVKVAIVKAPKSEVSTGKVRTVQELDDQLRKGSLSADTLSEVEAKTLVDELTIDDETAKILAKRVEMGKAVLREWCKTHEIRELEGSKGVAKVADGAGFSMDASKAVKILEKEKKNHLFNDILTVSATAFRKFLGSDLFEKNAKMETKPWSIVSLRRKKELTS